MSINLEDVPYPHPVQYHALTVDGHPVRMAYMDVAPVGPANGRTAVLLHGMNFFGEYWATTIEALTEAGFRVVVPDQVGFGRSSKPVMPYYVSQQATNTRDLLDALGLERVALVGHSMGGMIATRFAFLFPDRVTHLTLVNPIGMTDSRPGRAWSSLDALVASQMERDYDAVMANMRRYYVEWRPEYAKYARIHYGWTRSGAWPRMARVRAENIRMIVGQPVVYDWPHLRVPTLYLGGAEDGEDFRELVAHAVETIPGARSHLLDGVGHNPPLAAPDQLFPLLVEWLESDPE